MRLVVEDEDVRRSSVLGISRRLVHFDRAVVEGWSAKRFVDGDEERRQPAGALEELSTTNPELFGSSLRQLLYAKLDMLLLSGLRMRHVLAVGDHPGRNR